MSGLRERKKEAARAALHDAAWRLMTERGPENVTVEDIAEAASMSRRTFSNYFSSKEEAFFFRDDTRAAELVAMILQRPAEEDAVTALRQALVEFAKSSNLDEERMIQSRMLRSRPTMSAYRDARQIATENQLAAALLDRLPGVPRAELTARILAATALAAFRTARSYWHEQHGEEFTTIVAVALAHIEIPNGALPQR